MELHGMLKSVFHDIINYIEFAIFFDSIDSPSLYYSKKNHHQHFCFSVKISLKKFYNKIN